ncbi:MAG TPA: hypothetical protein VJ233_09175 [Hyphomicrobiaceae bacterium]|nr:hypothetical protein [Hyphomicrobiaceae bacterium]
MRIFALSRELSPQPLLKTVRAHWDIENGLHWQIHVTLREDAARKAGTMISCYICSVECDSPEMPPLGPGYLARREIPG